MLDNFFKNSIAGSIGKLFSIVLLAFCFGSFAQAQNVWTLDVAGTLPTGSLDVGVLKELSVGDTFDLRVDRTFIYPVRIDEVFYSSNGDQSWYGSITNTGLDYALVVTVGKLTAHIILTSPSGIFQLYGIRSGEDRYSGAFTRLEYVRDDVATTDTIIPGIDAGVQAQDVISSSYGISITQKVSEKVIAVGSTIYFDFTFANAGTEKQTGQFVDIFFVLENTTLDALPQGCEILESTESQPVLSCSLGDFAVGEEKRLAFSVTTTEQSHPLVYSTAIVDERRSDVIVELYRDVVTDSDEDGISDFNEQILGSDAFNGLEAISQQTAVIDVLVAYTSEIDAVYQGETQTRINQLFNVANKIFKDSNTDILLRPVGVHEVSYTPADELFTDLTTLTSQSDTSLANLGRMRNFYGGDLVVLFRTGEENGLCGLANLGGQGTQGDLSAEYHKGFAYSVINIDCLDDSVLAHEVGHNLGLVHSRREESVGGTFPHAAGFGEDTRFVTMMAFPDDFDVENRLYRFSDPTRECGQFQCGQDQQASDGADAVSALNVVKHQVADYYSSQEERITSVKTVSSKSGITSSVLGVEAYTTEGLDFSRSFNANEKINLRLKIAPLAQHIGKNFVSHLVVMNGNKALFQLTESGDFLPWSGRLDTLAAIDTPRLMGDRELFDLVNDLDFQSAALSGTLNIFVAYSIVETGELVYGASPLRLTLNELR